jgi:hypothetical protein
MYMLNELLNFDWLVREYRDEVMNVERASICEKSRDPDG